MDISFTCHHGVINKMNLYCNMEIFLYLFVNKSLTSFILEVIQSYILGTAGGHVNVWSHESFEYMAYGIYTKINQFC